MITIGQTSNDEVVGFTGDGMVYYEDRPPEVVVEHVRQVEFARAIWGSVACYYDAYTEQLVELREDQTRRSYKITQFIPAELTHLMTSTTPFECFDPTLILCARSYIWQFDVGCILKKRIRILPDNAAQHFDMNQTMTTVVLTECVYVYQNNVILHVDLNSAQPYQFYRYPQSMTITAVARGKYTMRNKTTGNVYTHDKIEGWCKLPSNYDHYNCDIYHNDDDYGLVNDRISVLDSEDILPKLIVTSYDIEF